MMNGSYKYSSFTIACLIVARANEMRLDINMTKLQKLLYVVYGTYLAINGKRLMSERPQAWPYGPVFPLVRSKLLKRDLSLINANSPEVSEIRTEEEIGALIQLVLRNFGDKTATALTVWSHQSGSPWDRVSSQEGFSWGEIIPDEFIEEYFNSILVKR